MASPDFKDFATAFFLIAANGRTGAEGSDSLSLLLSDHLPRLPLRMLPSSGGGGAMGPLPSGRRRQMWGTSPGAGLYHETRFVGQHFVLPNNPQTGGLWQPFLLLVSQGFLSEGTSTLFSQFDIDPGSEADGLV